MAVYLVRFHLDDVEYYVKASTEEEAEKKAKLLLAKDLDGSIEVDETRPVTIHEEVEKA